MRAADNAAKLDKVPPLKNGDKLVLNLTIDQTDEGEAIVINEAKVYKKRGRPKKV